MKLELPFSRTKVWTLTVYVPDGKGDLSPQFLLVELHFHDLEGETLVEESVDLRAAAELVSVDLRGARALYGSLEV